MNQNMGRLIRYILIIHRLSGTQKYVPTDELIRFLNLQMQLRGYEVGISVRTIQRDISEILSMFDVEIKNLRGKGYFIADVSINPDIRYEDLLMNFDLLTSINHSSGAKSFIIPEHHRPKDIDCFPALINAIKHCNTISFDYKLVRKYNRIIHKLVAPYFLKESLGLWYVIAKDESGAMKSFAVDRISNIEILEDTFTKDSEINPDALFKHSYGIWDDESIPIEEIELSYSQLDGHFLKSTPLHHSQQILVDNDTEFRIRLNLRITNDFVMALLARSNSLTVIKPLTLRKRINEVYEQALLRNKI